MSKFDEYDANEDDYNLEECDYKVYTKDEIYLVNSNIDKFNLDLQLLCCVSNVSFIDSSTFNSPNFVGRDGLHLNRRGSRALS